MVKFTKEILNYESGKIKIVKGAGTEGSWP
jgi:hypothetical protein